MTAPFISVMQIAPTQPGPEFNNCAWSGPYYETHFPRAAAAIASGFQRRPSPAKH